MEEKLVPNFELHQKCTRSGYLKTTAKHILHHPDSPGCTICSKGCFAPMQVAGLRDSDDQDDDERPQSQRSCPHSTRAGRMASADRLSHICRPRAAQAAEQPRGIQDASAPGAKAWKRGDPAVQHMGAMASASPGAPERHPLLPACASLTNVSKRVCSGQKKHRTAYSLHRFTFFLENPLLVIARDETLGWKDLRQNL